MLLLQLSKLLFRSNNRLPNASVKNCGYTRPTFDILWVFFKLATIHYNLLNEKMKNKSVDCNSIERYFACSFLSAYYKKWCFEANKLMKFPMKLCLLATSYHKHVYQVLSTEANSTVKSTYKRCIWHPI